MKLTNETDFNSQHLKAFIQKVAEIEQLTPDEIKKLVVKARYRKRSSRWQEDCPAGCGNYGAWRFTLSFSKDAMPDKRKLAKTIAVMLAFNQNVRYKTLKNSPHYGWNTGWTMEWAWANDLPLDRNQPIEKPDLPKRDKIVAEMEHCTNMIALWEKKAKLARTKQKIWQKKFVYYEKRFKVG
jgi:hypothetical protein